MANIYETSENRALVLYTSSQQILLCDKFGAHFGRPVVLANDYAGELIDIAFQNTIYYAYLDTAGHLTVRSVTDAEIIYRLDTEEKEKSTTSQFVVFDAKLFLFYLSQNSSDHLYSVSCISPLTPEISFEIPDVFPDAPAINVSAGNKKMILHVLNCKTSDRLYVIDETFHMEEICRKPKQAEENKVEQQYKNEINRLRAVIDSVSRQYNELMDVAQQYRAEAAKWHERFLHQ